MSHFNMWKVLFNIWIAISCVSLYAGRCNADRKYASVSEFPPRTDVGSFISWDNVDDSCEYAVDRTVYLYWQQWEPPLRPRLRNRANYEIISVVRDGQKIHLQPNEITKSFAKFNKLDFASYEFEIISNSSMGKSRNSSKVFLPKSDNVINGPKNLTISNVSHNDIYELTWEYSEENEKNIDDFTVFWCEYDDLTSKFFTFNRCLGYLDWKHVPKNTRSYNVTVVERKAFHSFYVSANSGNFSSGMKVTMNVDGELWYSKPTN